jgi:Superfamily II DNA helicase
MSPFNNVVESQRFASSLARNQPRPPTCTVSDDGRFVTYKEITMEIEKWILGLHALLADTKTMVKELCHGKTIDVTIPDNVPDDMSENKRGYSWLDNGTFVKNRALLDILMHIPGLKVAQATQGGLVFNTSYMQYFMSKASDIQDNLSVLCDATPGQTARATEFIETKIRNSNRPRNFFRRHGADWIIIRRVKSESMMRKEVFIPKKVPPELQELLDFYLLVIRPIEIDFAYHLWGIDTATLYHEFLFVRSEKRTTAAQYGRTLATLSEKYFDCRTDIRPYRQMEIAIAKAYLGSEYEVYEEDLTEEEDLLAKQSGHGPGIRRTHYAVEHGMLPSLTFDLLLRYGAVSESWWKLVRFYPGAAPMLPLAVRRRIRHQAHAHHSADSAGGGELSLLAHGDASGTSASIDVGRLIESLTGVITASVSQLRIDLHKEIQGAVAAGVAEVLVQQSGGVQLPRRTQAPMQGIEPRPTEDRPPASEPAPQTEEHPNQAHWDAVEDLYDTENRYGTQPAYCAQDAMQVEPTAEDSAVTQDMLVDETPAASSDVALELLRKLYPDQANVDFKSPQQREIVEQSLERKRNFFGILPTGGGKSLAWLIPAISEETGVTVVVIPNKALLNDMLRKTQDLEIPACKWTASNTHISNARLVYIALESVTSVTFQA